MDLLSHRIELQGFEKSYDPEADGDCFYQAAAFQLGREGTGLKNELFDYLAQNQYDSQGQNRLDFVCSDDIQNQDVPSDWSEALTLLRRSCANEMVIRALSESLHCRITIITTSGETPDSYVKVIVLPEQHGTPRCSLFFGHTGDHYFALKEKILHYRGETFISCCSLIYSLNEDKENVNACVDVLCRYLDNIRNNPIEEKYQKIKQSNKIFQERVAPVKGATEFLLACGFEYKVLPGEGSEERFFVLPKEACSDCERLNVFKEALVSVVDWMSKLDRCLKPSLPDSDDKSEVWLKPHEFSAFLNYTLPVEYLIGEMFWWQEMDKAMQSDPDHLWSREHITGSYAEGLCIPLSLLHQTGNNSSAEDWKIISADLLTYFRYYPKWI